MKPRNPAFDGRSFGGNCLKYTRWQRFIVRIAVHVMPLLSRMLIFDRLNTFAWECLGCTVGRGTVIRVGTFINAPFMVTIGANCLIHGHLKSRGGIKIGDGVELVEDVLISTQSHNADSVLFESIYLPVIIDDFSWIGPRAIVLSGVTLKCGSMVGAGAVVTKSTTEWGVYVGVPATRIKDRARLAVE